MDQSTALNIITAHSPSDALPDMPIEPAQITAGNPVARGVVLTQSADKKRSSGFWSCEPGEFDWDYTWDEFVYVLEGEVTISAEDGNSRTLGPGDVAHFPIGLKSHWKVTKTVRKFFVLHTPEPLEL